MDTSDGRLIAAAVDILKPPVVDGRPIGDVACALVTAAGTMSFGVCIDTSSGTGFCAEHSAIAAMVTAAEHKIAKLVALWRDNTDVLHVVPPFGRCRDFIRQIDPADLATEVILGANRSARIRELLLHHEWPG